MWLTGHLIKGHILACAVYYEEKDLTKAMFTQLLLVLGLTAVYCYDAGDGILWKSDGFRSRAIRSVRQWMPNNNHQMAMMQRMNNARTLSWQPGAFHGNGHVQRMQNRPYWISRVYPVPFNAQAMRMSSGRAPFQWRPNIPNGRFQFQMMSPWSAGQRLPTMNTPWQPVQPSQNQMFWNPPSMQRFPMMVRRAFGHRSTGSGGFQSSTESSAGKGPQGVTPFDDRR